ncbi:hypothetical protein K438DRAFT_1574893, partial [Mycena galopus ATCC 62051]
RLPWYVDVTNAQGVTLLDVLQTLFDELNQPIVARDFWNDEMRLQDRDRLMCAFKEQCSINGREYATEIAKGVKRVDFLGPDVIFVGLVRKKNGVWEIKTT